MPLKSSCSTASRRFATRTSQLPLVLMVAVKGLYSQLMRDQKVARGEAPWLLQRWAICQPARMSPDIKRTWVGRRREEATVEGRAGEEAVRRGVEAGDWLQVVCGDIDGSPCLGGALAFVRSSCNCMR